MRRLDTLVHAGPPRGLLSKLCIYFKMVTSPPSAIPHTHNVATHASRLIVNSLFARDQASHTAAKMPVQYVGFSRQRTDNARQSANRCPAHRRPEQRSLGWVGCTQVVRLAAHKFVFRTDNIAGILWKQRRPQRNCRLHKLELFKNAFAHSCWGGAAAAESEPGWSAMAGGHGNGISKTVAYRRNHL